MPKRKKGPAVAPDDKFASETRELIAAAGIREDLITLFKTGEILDENKEQTMTLGPKDRLTVGLALLHKASPNAKPVGVNGTYEQDRAAGLLEEVEEYKKQLKKAEKDAGVENVPKTERENEDG